MKQDTCPMCGGRTPEAEASSLHAVIQGILGLHELVLAGQNDGDKADAIRERTYGPWMRLTSEEEATAKAISALLQELEDRKEKS